MIDYQIPTSVPRPEDRLDDDPIVGNFERVDDPNWKEWSRKYYEIRDKIRKNINDGTPEGNRELERQLKRLEQDVVDAYGVEEGAKAVERLSTDYDAYASENMPGEGFEDPWLELGVPGLQTALGIPQLVRGKKDEKEAKRRKPTLNYLPQPSQELSTMLSKQQRRSEMIDPSLSSVREKAALDALRRTQILNRGLTGGQPSKYAALNQAATLGYSDQLRRGALEDYQVLQGDRKLLANLIAQKVGENEMLSKSRRDKHILDYRDYQYDRDAAERTKRAGIENLVYAGHGLLKAMSNRS